MGIRPVHLVGYYIAPKKSNCTSIGTDTIDLALENHVEKEITCIQDGVDRTSTAIETDDNNAGAYFEDCTKNAELGDGGQVIVAEDLMVPDSLSEGPIENAVTEADGESMLVEESLAKGDTNGEGSIKAAEFADHEHLVVKEKLIECSENVSASECLSSTGDKSARKLAITEADAGKGTNSSDNVIENEKLREYKQFVRDEDSRRICDSFSSGSKSGCQENKIGSCHSSIDAGNLAGEANAERRHLDSEVIMRTETADQKEILLQPAGVETGKLTGSKTAEEDKQFELDMTPDGMSISGETQRGTSFSVEPLSVHDIGSETGAQISIINNEKLAKERGLVENKLDETEIIIDDANSSICQPSFSNNDDHEKQLDLHGAGNSKNKQKEQVEEVESVGNQCNTLELEDQAQKLDNDNSKYCPVDLARNIEQDQSLTATKDIWSVSNPSWPPAAQAIRGADTIAKNIRKKLCFGESGAKAKDLPTTNYHNLTSDKGDLAPNKIVSGRRAGAFKKIHEPDEEVTPVQGELANHDNVGKDANMPSHGREIGSICHTSSVSGDSHPPQVLTSTVNRNKKRKTRTEDDVNQAKVDSEHQDQDFVRTETVQTPTSGISIEGPRSISFPLAKGGGLETKGRKKLFMRKSYEVNYVNYKDDGEEEDHAEDVEPANSTVNDLHVTGGQHNVIRAKGISLCNSTITNPDPAANKSLYEDHKIEINSQCQENEGSLKIGSAAFLSKEEKIGVVDKKLVVETAQARNISDGLLVEDLQQGDPGGKVATSGLTVKIHYTIYLMRCNRNIGRYISEGSHQFELGSRKFIKGWSLGIEGMRVGGKRRLVIPPKFGYGEKGSGDSIPPNSWMVQDIELLHVD